ncbi:TKL protein kinase [Saprolegnia parasitica CBS 223.65]|uniref:TKL protein kinase n=1 Tax=Saprolegnia parasitica (strain CBS 223.65) TaxID=695850 RepID=A0A067BU54_SAPPC|nr:TKL protein kinase [Saprolegnia parasitica CBS 223.65]KDO17811.1 TKL protein kinase [Saprolegnia parasitica CBS 223.65]|eukprot:XP_012211481.1 TKL protein kinase [Saprolegnia parasitica CBS 223.65]
MPTNDEYSLLTAAASGNVAKVQSYLDKRVNVNCTDSIYTPLHRAAYNGHVDVARLLLDKGADVEASNANGYTPLHYAAQGKKPEMVEFLLAKGAKIDAKNKNGQTPREVAEARGSNDFVATLLRDYPRMQEEQLFDALREKRIPDAMRILQNNFYHVNLRDSSETPLLHVVVATQDLSLLQMLLQRRNLQIDAKDSMGRTALTVAITTGTAELVQALYQAGASVDLVDLSLRASTPVFAIALHQAASINEGSTVAQLLRLGVSSLLANEKGETAWHVAAAKGYMSILMMLLQQETKDENGIDVTNHNEESPLFVATTSGHAGVVKCLLRANASPHIISHDGSTLLHAAVIGGNMIVLHQIVQSGVNVDASDAMGQTPLHIASEKAYDSVVKYLLDVDANVFAKDKTGKTPLMLATHPLVINTLLQAEKSTKQKIPLLSEAMLDHIVTRVSTSETMLDHIITRVSSSETMLDQLVDRICASEAMLSKLVQRICDRLDVGHEALEASVDRPEGTRGANGHAQAVFVNDASQELLADDSDSDAANAAGDSPLHLAVQTNDHKTLMSLLRSPSINVDVRNAAGVTPLTLAIQMGHRRLATMLQTAVHRIIPSVPATDIKMDQSSPIYGTVYKGTYKGRVVAIKTHADESSAQAIIHEMETMQQCNSAYVQQLLAVSDINSTSPKLVLEYMDAGDLRSYLDAKRLGEPTKVNVSSLEVAWVVANALADLHHNGVFHQDLESYNVLLSSTNYVKVANLGSGLESDATTGKSTPYWTAPEVLASTSNYSFAADIYSFGVILTELDTLQLPFHDAKGLGYWGIIDGVRLGNLRPTVSANCPQWLRDLADACLSFDPRLRPSAQLIVQSLQKLLDRSEEELLAPFKSEQTAKLAEPSLGSPTRIIIDESPQPPTSDATSDPDTAPAAVTTTSLIASTVSATTSNAKSVSTQIVCQLCRVSNSLLQTHCQGCAEELASVPSKLKTLLKRLSVVKKSGWEIDDDLVCTCCDTHQPMEATTCDNCDDALPDDQEKLRILVLRIEQVSKSKA